MKPKICIVHDMFVYRGGAERLVVMMANALGADIVTGFVSDATYDMRGELGFRGSCITLISPRIRGALRHLLLKFSFRFRTRFLRGYDIVVFSGDCLAATHGIRRDARAFFYCHTPPRYLFDQRALYLAKVRPRMRPIFSLACWIFAWWYRRDLRRIPTIFANSENVRARIRTYLGRDAEVIYPAVDTTRFTPSSVRRDYFVSFARLATIKRVDRIVEAFSRMPDRSLTLVYGDQDPQRDAILARVSHCTNIHTVRNPRDAELQTLLAESLASIYIPRDEDFGMSPIESMACGVPVIGVHEGGIRESVRDGETGILIDPEASVEDIVRAVRSLDRTRALGMQDACVARAWEFSEGVFRARIRLGVLGGVEEG